MNRRWAGPAVVALVICMAACGGASAIGGPPASSPPSDATAPGPSDTAVATRTPDPTPVDTPKPTNKPEPSEELIAPVPEPSGELVAVLTVRCGDGAPELSSDRVRAARDGVTLQVTGREGWTLGVESESTRESVALEKADQAVVLRVAPGDVMIDCGDPAQIGPPPGAPVRIEDPDAWYRSMAIGNVAGSCVSGDALLAEDARGSKEDPVGQARKLLKGLRADDVVQRGGYPADKGLVRVLRNDEVVGTMTYVDDGHGGWLLLSSVSCGGLSGT
jgi:hypothetical protein